MQIKFGTDGWRGVIARDFTFDNLSLVAWSSRTPGQIAGIDKVLEYIPELTDMMDKRAGRLSGGQQKLVALGRSLMLGRRLLLLDEPFEGLAPAVVEQLFETFDRLRKEIAIIIVDHNLDLALALSYATVVL